MRQGFVRDFVAQDESCCQVAGDHIGQGLRSFVQSIYCKFRMSIIETFLGVRSDGLKHIM